MATAAARTVACPSCTAQPGNSCTMESENGSRVFVSTYHYPRIMAAQTAEAPQEALA